MGVTITSDFSTVDLLLCCQEPSTWRVNMSIWLSKHWETLSTIPHFGGLTLEKNATLKPKSLSIKKWSPHLSFNQNGHGTTKIQIKLCWWKHYLAILQILQLEISLDLFHMESSRTSAPLLWITFSNRTTIRCSSWWTFNWIKPILMCS